MNAKHPLKKKQEGLPGYLGGKGSLSPWIFGKLQHAIARSQWPQMVLADAFMGSGAITQFAKALGFQAVFANDHAFHSRCVALALLVNETVRLHPEDLLYLNQPLPDESKADFVSQHFCPSVFATRHAKALDRWLFWARQIQDPTRQALFLVLIWHMIYEFVSFPTSVGTSNKPYAMLLDGLVSADTINPKRFTDQSIQRLCRPAFPILQAKAQKLNDSLFSGSPVTFTQDDALHFVQNVEADLLYADPPYANTSDYGQTYKVLDSVLQGEIIQPVRSTFSRDTDPLHALFDHARHIPHWIISYGNKTIDCDGLVSLVQAHAGNRKVQGFSRHFTHMRHVSKNTQNQELLVIAVREPEIINYAK